MKVLLEKMIQIMIKRRKKTSVLSVKKVKREQSKKLLKWCADGEIYKISTKLIISLKIINQLLMK